MKKTLLLLASLTLPVGLVSPAHAAKEYTSFEAAQQQVTDTGYILFFYPAGWDKYGEKLCKKLIADQAVCAAAGDAVMLMAPVYQKRNEETNAKAKKTMGHLGYPNDMSDISYPAIVFYEKGGRMYSTLCGEKLMTASAKEVAALIKQRLDAKKKQQALLDQSGATNDVGEKTRLVLASARVEGIEWPNNLKDTLKSIDPSDAHGCRAALDFGFGAQANESMEAFTKRLDAVLANKLLTKWQKQRACAAAIGHIRRSYGSMAGGPLIAKYAIAPRGELECYRVCTGLFHRHVMHEHGDDAGGDDFIAPPHAIAVLSHPVTHHYRSRNTEC